MELEIEADATTLIAALDALGEGVQAHILAAAKVSADSIAREYHARVARRRGGPTRRGTHTADTIRVIEATVGVGFLVGAASPAMPNLPHWLEKGTVKMTARPALGPAADLEAGPHDRRMREAIQSAIDEQGLGA